MDNLSWGKPDVFVKKKTETQWTKLPPAVLDSTTLTTTKGEKKEAKIEGGGVEAVKYDYNTYALEMSIRKGKDNGETRKLPFDDTDGVVPGVYEFMLIPEDHQALGFKVAQSVISVEDTFTASEGAQWKLTFDFLRPDEGNTIVWGVQTDPTASV